MHAALITAIIVIIVVLIIVILYATRVFGFGYYYTNADMPSVRFPTQGGVAVKSVGDTTFLMPLKGELASDGYYYWPEYDNMAIIVKTGTIGYVLKMKPSGSETLYSVDVVNDVFARLEAGAVADHSIWNRKFAFLK